MKFVLLVSLPLYALDQMTKWLVLRFVVPDEPPHVIIPDVFHLVNVTNTGAAFGILKNNNLAFVVLCFLALLFIVPLLLHLHVPLAHPWPAFNVADSCICVAVICFIIHSFKQKESSPTSAT